MLLPLKHSFLIALWLMLPLSACDRSRKTESSGPQYTMPPAPTTQDASAARPLTFCVVPALTPAKVVQRFQPLIDLMSERLKQANQPPLQLVVARDHDDFSRRLAQRGFSIAVVSSATAVLCLPMGYKPFAKAEHDEKFYGILLVPRSSPIKSIDDLRGKLISFPNRSVMSGSLMIRMFLHDHGLERDRDYRALYCESYDSAVMNLTSGRCDAAAIGSAPLALLKRDRPDLAASLDARFQTNPLPQLEFIASSDVSDAALQAICDTLFHLDETPQGRAALVSQNVDGFVPADEATLEPVREFVARYAATFGQGDF